MHKHNVVDDSFVVTVANCSFYVLYMERKNRPNVLLALQYVEVAEN